MQLPNPIRGCLDGVWQGILGQVLAMHLSAAARQSEIMRQLLVSVPEHTRRMLMLLQAGTGHEVRYSS